MNFFKSKRALPLIIFVLLAIPLTIISVFLSRQPQRPVVEKAVAGDVVYAPAKVCPADFGRDLKLGVIGDDVKALQRYLNNNGFALADNGVGSKGRETIFFGSLTRQALARFQVAKGIAADLGDFDIYTRDYLGCVINRQPANETASNPADNSKPAEVATGHYTVGGRITGLDGTIVLQNNNQDELTIKPSDSSVFIFPTALSDGQAYAVTIKTKPAGHDCYVNRGTGIITGANVGNVEINCGRALSHNPFIFTPGTGGTVSYTLTYTAGANGSLTGTTPQTVNSGANGSAVTAVADTHYHFVNWSDGSTANPRTDTSVAANKTVTANFAIDTYTLTYAAGVNGSLTGSASQTVNYGASGSAVTAVADAHYHFVNWSDGSTANPRTDTSVAADKSVTANFTIDTFTITASAGTGGTIDPAGVTTKDYGTSQTYTFTPDMNYSVQDIFIDSVSVGSGGGYEFTNIDANHTIEVTFFMGAQ